MDINFSYKQLQLRLNYLVIQKKYKIKKNGDNVPNLGVFEAFLVRCNFVDSQYQQIYEILCTLTLYRSSSRLLTDEPSSIEVLKT